LELRDIVAMGFDALLTGFTENEIESLSTPENDPFREWVGMPEFEQNSKEAWQTIAVHFKDEDAVKAFAQLTNQQITDKTKFMWYPADAIESYVEQQFKSEAAE
jgi:hypothetical protein